MGSPDGTSRFSAFTRPPLVATSLAQDECAAWRGWERDKRSEGEHLSTIWGCLRGRWGTSAAFLVSLAEQGSSAKAVVVVMVALVSPRQEQGHIFTRTLYWDLLNYVAVFSF